LIATQLNYTEQQLEAYKEMMSLNIELSKYIERLESTQKQLIQANKLNALGQLAASVAHEINNPLAGALVYSKLLSKKIGGESFNKEETLTNLAKVETAISFCSGIVKDLLDFARQSEPMLRPLLVGSVIDQVISMVDHQAEMKHVEIIREESSPSQTVLADSDQLKQVLINLVLNAIQAMPDGGKLIIRSSADEDGWARISVQDTGCGIAPENMEKLFTPFFTTKEKGKGVGLGLAVSYGIVERHGGRIEVESELGKGSTFTIRLPAYSI
jgi:two-component system NtrC family sensor kinase